jgi:signal transduction histidine kinase
LRTQIALSRLLLDDFGPGLGEEGAQYAKLISQAAERQMDLIQDLMAHITVSRADLPIGSVEIRSVVDAAISDLSIDIHKRHANVAWERVESRCVLANAPNLHLAIMNLLSNALKFVPSHLRPEVSIWTETKPGTVRLLLQDNGIGIESKDLSRLFGMFQRVNPQTGYPGTGLGLALVKKAVERMGGAVGVESSPGCGSRFWIDLKEAP